MQAAHLMVTGCSHGCTRFKPTVLSSKQDLTGSTLARVIDQAHSWFNSLASSDLVQLRNLAPSVGNFFFEQERWKSAEADADTRKSRQSEAMPKKPTLTLQVLCSCQCAFP